MAVAWLVRPAIPAAIGASATTTGAASNLLNDYMGVVWTANAAAAGIGGGIYYHYVDIDMGGNTTIDTLLALGVSADLPGSAIFVLHAATAAQGQFTGTFWSSSSTPVYAGSAALVSGDQVTLWSSPANGTPAAPSRYYRLVWQASSAFALRIRRIVINTRWSPARNFSYGAAFGVRDLGSYDFSSRGVPLVRAAKKLRTLGLTFSSLHKNEVEEFVQPLIEGIGNDGALAIVTDPAAHAMRTRRSYYGRLVGDLGTVRRNAAAWEWRANMVSLI